MKVSGALLATALIASSANADVDALLFSMIGDRNLAFEDDYRYYLYGEQFYVVHVDDFWCGTGIQDFEFMTREEAIERGFLDPSEFLSPTAAPEPASAVLLGLGACSLLRRRR
ncbi:MAG: PEP-CTERM sorting domain-containing protein [Phycisphaeraceae bacterium]